MMTLDLLRKQWEKDLEEVQTYPLPFGLIVVLKDKKGHLRVYHYFEGPSDREWNISIEARCDNG